MLFPHPPENNPKHRRFIHKKSMAEPRRELIPTHTHPSLTRSTLSTIGAATHRAHPAGKRATRLRKFYARTHAHNNAPQYDDSGSNLKNINIIIFIHFQRHADMAVLKNAEKPRYNNCNTPHTTILPYDTRPQFKLLI